MKRHWSFRTRFVLTATLCLIPLLVVLVYVMQQSLAESREKTIENEVSIGNVIAKGVAQTLSDNVNVLTDIATIEDVREMDAKGAGLTLDQYKRSRPSLYGIMLVAPDHSIVATAGGIDSAAVVPLVSNEINAVFTVGETTVSGLLNMKLTDSDSQGAIGLVVPVLADPAAAQSSTPVGAVVGLLNVSRIGSTFTPAFDFAATNTIAAVVDNGEIIVRGANADTTDSTQVDDLSQPLTAAAAGKRSNLNYTDSTGEDRVAVFAPVEFESADWSVVVSNPAPTVSGQSRDFVARSLIALGVAVLVTLGLALFFGELASRPVRRLTSQAEAIAHGDYVRSVEPVGSGEFVDLSEAVAEMANRLTTQVRDLDSARIEVAAQAERLRDLLRRTVRLQEDERRRIAGDIHDAVSPLITGALYQARALQLGSPSVNIGAPVDEPEDENLTAITSLLERAMDELHSVIFALRPPDLDDLGVEAAIERYVDQINRNGLPSSFEVIGEPRRLSPEARLAIYRIVQEALHNALRHAQADEAVVRMEWTDDLLRVTIRDNGSGFDPDQAANATSLGLLSMRERAASIGASLLIASQPGDGTVVVIERPHSQTVNLDGSEPATEQLPGGGYSVPMPIGAPGR
jgi:signal transduction histidine kinase